MNIRVIPIIISILGFRLECLVCKMCYFVIIFFFHIRLQIIIYYFHRSIILPSRLILGISFHIVKVLIPRNIAIINGRDLTLLIRINLIKIKSILLQLFTILHNLSSLNELLIVYAFRFLDSQLY